MERRSLLKTVGGITATSALGAGGLLFAAQGASATGSQTLNSTSVTSDDGTVTYVAIYGDTTVTWDGFERPAKSFDIVSEVEYYNSNGNRIGGPYTVNVSGPHDLTADSWGGDSETFSGAGTSGSISSDVGLRSNGNHDPSTDWAIVQAADYDDPYGLPTDPAPVSPLEVDEDGQSASYTVRLLSTYRWFANTDGTDKIFEKTFESDIPLTVNNEPQSASATSGSGEDGAVAE